MNITGFSPRPSQAAIFSAKERFLILDAGRRFGKSLTGLNWLLAGACERPRENWYVSPIYSQGKMAFRTFLSAAHKGKAEDVFKSISHSEMRIEFVNGAAMTFKSADNPDNLRGEGLHRVVVDEAARVRREVWEAILRPAVSDTHGRVLFISTPKGKNWFYELFTRGQDPLQPEFESFKRFPTADNPKVLASDIEQARQSLPVDVFSQEYLAEFLENSAGVFRNIEACIGSIREEPLPGKEYRGGLDLARTTDFSVLTIFDTAGRQVFLDRFNQLSWAVQKDRFIPVIRKYRAKVAVDATGVGDPIVEDLKRAGLDIIPYVFTSESKKRLIETAMVGFDQKQIRILNDEVQRGELDMFEYRMGKTGTVQYSAPEGAHDDCVIALCLAWYLLHGPIIIPSVARIRW
jgi:phage terminase large subunit-like protein